MARMTASALAICGEASEWPRSVGCVRQVVLLLLLLLPAPQLGGGSRPPWPETQHRPAAPACPGRAPPRVQETRASWPQRRPDRSRRAHPCSVARVRFMLSLSFLFSSCLRGDVAHQGSAIDHKTSNLDIPPGDSYVGLPGIACQAPHAHTHTQKKGSMFHQLIPH